MRVFYIRTRLGVVALEVRPGKQPFTGPNPRKAPENETAIEALDDLGLNQPTE